MDKMNFLLVMPRLLQTIGEGYTFPMGIAYVSASLKAAGYNVITINLNHIEGDVHHILEKTIREHAVDVVATGGYSCWFLSIQNIIRSVKAIREDIVTVVGGAIITAEPDVALEALEYADIGVIGEGEITICELAKHLEEDADLGCVKGVIIRRNGDFFRAEKREDIPDLNALPWPDYEGFQFDKYLTTRGDAQVYSFSSYDRTAYVMGSRSCPYKCTFCTRGVTGDRYRQRTIENIKSEIVHLQDRYGVNAVIMTDELFGRKIERVREFARDMAQLKMPWEASFRVDCVSTDLVEILKNSTCFGLLLGIESGDDRILKSMHKGVTVKQISEALQLVYDAGIMLDGNLIFGDVAETLDTARTTLRWWRDHSRYAIALSMINAYPGTDIYKYACRMKLIDDPVGFLKAGGMQQVNVSKMSDEEVGVLTKEIIETPYKYGPQVKNIDNYRVDSNGRASFAGKCCKCNADNSWREIQVFTRSKLLCTQCRQKHYAPILSEIREAFVTRVLQLLDDKENSRIAIWGVLDRSIGIMDEIPILRNPNIVFIDNAFWKQKVMLNGKRVYDPTVIIEQNIPTIITFYVEMGSLQHVVTYAQKYCPSVRRIIRADEMLQGFKVDRV